MTGSEWAGVNGSSRLHGRRAVECVIGAEPARVFAVLADGWSYPLWVVGATHMREVDRGWPAVGTRLHHSVGVWPLSVEDVTEVLDVQPGRRIVLRAHAPVVGSADIELVLTPVPEGTLVRMLERVASGPGRLLPEMLQHVLLYPRNVESLLRLRAIAENRRTPSAPKRYPADDPR